MDKLHSVLEKVFSRIKLALLVLKGVVPSRLNPGDALGALQAELAAARAETNRLAAAFADASLNPEALTGELEEARKEISHLNAEVSALRSACPPETHSPLVNTGGQPPVSKATNSSLNVRMPKSVLRKAREEEFKVVDVGAQMLDSADHVYAELVSVLSGHVVGFEPLDEERHKRIDKERNVIILPHAIGSGKPGTLHVTRFNPSSSLLEPDHGLLADYLALPEMLQVTEKIPVETLRLDDVPEATGCRFLKIDVQGGELDVLSGAADLLRGILVVFVEVEFVSIYKSQPLFCQIHALLESHGFELLDLLEPGYGSYRAANSGLLQSRLLWADGLYVRKLETCDNLPETQLIQLACAAHFLAKKFDYAVHVLAWCDKKYGTSFGDDYHAELVKAI
jgi:FkbM family methyltransferase